MKKITILLLITLVITLPIHELSHLLIAKEFAVNASYISFGYKIPFLPEIYAHTEVNGITIFINPILLGAAVDVGYEKTKSLDLYKRILIAAAGPVSNILLGIIFLFLAGILNGKKFLRSIRESLFSVILILNSYVREKNMHNAYVVAPIVNNMNRNGLFHITKPEDIRNSIFALSTIGMLSIIIGGLSLAPALPLDGGWILVAILEQIYDTNTAFFTAKIVSLAMLALVLWIIVKTSPKK